MSRRRTAVKIALCLIWRLIFLEKYSGTARQSRKRCRECYKSLSARRGRNIAAREAHLIQKFDPKVGDISLYLTLSELQVKRAKISEELWLSQLVGLLPNDMAQLIAREPEEVTEDYEQVEQILLKRYKLSAEMFRQMFTKHSKNADGAWKDFVYELGTYFEEWIEGLKVETLSNYVI
ncbi:hypothetical protein AVEN_202249-1 [Araneus ventricosus]|uniref:SCAN box domain-containing protein n=1 Tax=Araneus ventricosus TaxID=182803 RepID=A0A4Y2CNX7_ARAVE|nr:hypothetical protein AVEN_202249-1 [Araneus ventricosus]